YCLALQSTPGESSLCHHATPAPRQLNAGVHPGKDAAPVPFEMRVLQQEHSAELSQTAAGVSRELQRLAARLSADNGHGPLLLRQQGSDAIQLQVVHGELGAVAAP